MEPAKNLGITQTQVGQLVVGRGRRKGRLPRPTSITACAIFLLFFGVVLVVLAAFVPSRPGYAWKPLFDYRMSEDTFRLYAAIVGLGAIYLAYAFYQLQIHGLILFSCAFLVVTLNNLIHLNPARAVVMLVDVGFYALVVWGWMPVLQAAMEKRK